MAHSLGDWRLNDCTLYVTKSPPDVLGALVIARIGKVVYGLPDEKWAVSGRDRPRLPAAQTTIRLGGRRTGSAQPRHFESILCGQAPANAEKARAEKSAPARAPGTPSGKDLITI